MTQNFFDPNNQNGFASPGNSMATPAQPPQWNIPQGNQYPGAQYNPAQNGPGAPGMPYQQAPPPQPPQQPRRVCQKRSTQTGRAVQCGSLVIVEGYFNTPKVTDVNGSPRISFCVVEEQFRRDNTGNYLYDEQGQPQVSHTWHRCQAWGDVARFLTQVPEGTPIKVTGTLVNWSLAPRNPNETRRYFTEVRVSQHEFP
jgi:single-stranded DNA-binding protein